MTRAGSGVGAVQEPSFNPPTWSCISASRWPAADWRLCQHVAGRRRGCIRFAHVDRQIGSDLAAYAWLPTVYRDGSRSPALDQATRRPLVLGSRPIHPTAFPQSLGATASRVV